MESRSIYVNRRLITFLCLSVIIILATSLRVHSLGNIHSGFLADEAVNAYDSFSILKVGKNLWGESFPLFFNHHDVDSVFGLYIYSSAPFIYFFGLSEFSARLAAAAYGVLTVIMTFLFTKEVFKNNAIALVAAILLAISPWHILFSRVALRGITLPFFFLLGAYFLLKGQHHIKNSIFSGLFLGICFYTYSVVRLFLPLLLVVYCVLFRKHLYACKRNAIVCFIVMGVIASPVYYYSVFKGGTNRFRDISIFNQVNVDKAKDGLTSSDNFKSHLADLPDIGISGLMFLKNYVALYSPHFLFLSRGKSEEPNLLYWFEFPFILYGVFLLFVRRIPEHRLILWWLILYPIPTSLTVPAAVPHRAINGLPVFQIIAAYGVVDFFSRPWFQKQRRLIFMSPVIALIVLLSVYVSLNNYFNIYPLRSGEHWQYGFREAIAYTESVKEDYDEIVFSHNLHNAYALILFYSKYDPGRYLSSPEMEILKTPQNIWLKLHEIGKYKIRDVEEAYVADDGRLYVVKPYELPNAKPKKIIYYKDGTPAIKIIS